MRNSPSFAALAFPALLLVFTSACGQKPSDAREYPLEGQVLSLTADHKEANIKHGEIKGFMEAMTMGYRIDPPSLLEGLKRGDKVRFTIDVQRRTIIELEKLTFP